MRRTYGGGRKSRRPKKTGESKTVDEIVRELRQNISPASNYRERSLSIHGLICAKCGREFNNKNRHLLTVHHKDGNHRNNPPDGSNWENLCVYCHEDEHSRELLGDYLSGEEGDGTQRAEVEAQGDGAILSGVGMDEVKMFNPVRPGDTHTVEAQWTDLRRSQTKLERGFAAIKCKVTGQEGESVVEYGYRYLVACRDSWGKGGR